ncbi:MAG: hypothetical protein R3208_13370, partial [Ketobacteraceae bacterium]|nr:hypothetical protein [Ketobacteraceae bacterium]
PLQVLRERLLYLDRKEGVDKFSPMAKPGVVVHEDVILLREPHGSSPAVSLETVRQGTPLDIKGENHGYYRVSVPVEGWVSKDRIKLENEQLHLQELIDV